MAQIISLAERRKRDALHGYVKWGPVEPPEGMTRERRAFVLFGELDKTPWTDFEQAERDRYMHRLVQRELDCLAWMALLLTLWAGFAAAIADYWREP